MNNLSLSIRHVAPQQPQAETWQHGVIWHGVDEIEIELGDAHWYGGGGLVNQQWPLEKIALHHAPFLTSDNGNTGLLGILEPFWWNSKGQGVLVESDAFSMGFNAPVDGEPPLHSFFESASNDVRPQLADGLATRQTLHIRGKNLRIRFFELDTPRAVVETFWEHISIPPSPDARLFEAPLWTTWAQFKNHITQDSILHFVDKIREYQFDVSIFGIDAKWQQAFGDTRFDSDRFPNPRAMVAAIQDHGMHVTLWCIPFFMPTSEHYPAALDAEFVLKKSDSDEAYIGQWWEGKAAFLDVTNPEAMNWHLDNLQSLARAVALDGFKFDAGEGMFFANPETRRQQNDAPNNATLRYVEQTSQVFPWSDVRTGWRAQHLPMLFRQWDKSTRWGFDNGLASCLTQSITLNMLGYPFSFPDMIGGNQYGDDHIDAELLIRWTQAVAPMPIMQFSLAPWDYGDECAVICARYAHLHRELAPRNIALAQQKVPIVRPLWWQDPSDSQCLACDDQYLVGDDLLVAPVIHPGAESRAIYLPRGQWQSYWDTNEVHTGGGWLRDYPAPLASLPLFWRV